MNKVTRLVALSLVLASLASCTNMSRSQQGALSGGVLGAGAGFGISALAGGSLGIGAAVGGAIGAIAGGIMGHNK